MRYSTQIKPISYVKAHAAQILIDIAETREPIIITQNGEAKAVLQDVVSFEATQEMLAMLKILAMGRADIAAGQTKPVNEVLERLKAKGAARK